MPLTLGLALAAAACSAAPAASTKSPQEGPPAPPLAVASVPPAEPPGEAPEQDAVEDPPEIFPPLVTSWVHVELRLASDEYWPSISLRSSGSISRFVRTDVCARLDEEHLRRCCAGSMGLASGSTCEDPSYLEQEHTVYSHSLPCASDHPEAARYLQEHVRTWSYTFDWASEWRCGERDGVRVSSDDLQVDSAVNRIGHPLELTMAALAAHCRPTLEQARAEPVVIRVDVERARRLKRRLRFTSVPAGAEVWLGIDTLRGECKPGNPICSTSPVGTTPTSYEYEVVEGEAEGAVATEAIFYKEGYERFVVREPRCCRSHAVLQRSTDAR